jgi:putative ABC transport system substrate-binding protein
MHTTTGRGHRDQPYAESRRQETIRGLHTVGILISLALGILVAPLTAAAQPVAQPPRLGVLGMGPPQRPHWEAFLHGLQDLGYMAGQNLTIEERFAAGDPEHFPALAAELVRLPVAVIFARGPAALLAAKQATDTLPIVAIDLESDPVQSGFAANLARPGGTITGVFPDMPGLVGKWLELLKEAVPQLTRITVLWDPTTGPFQRDAAYAAAGTLAIELHTLEVRTAAEFATAFLAATQLRPDALLVLGSPLMSRNSKVIANFAATSRLPALSTFRLFPEAGGLMAYGPSQPEMFRRCGVQVGKILQGAKPGDLPIERPIRFELIINLQTAQALGLTIPPLVLFQADEVIR